MAKVGAQRAAILTGKSKSTVQRAMNSGKLSFELDQNNRRVIDVSELERVFGIKPQNTEKEAGTAAAPQASEPIATKSAGSDELIEAVEKERMRMQIKMLEQQLNAADERVGDLTGQRDKWEKQASQILITSQYSQKQAEELRSQIKEREERARQRRLQNAQVQNTQANSSKGRKKPTSLESKMLEDKMKKLNPQNENDTKASDSVFRFWKKAKG